MPRTPRIPTEVLVLAAVLVVPLVIGFIAEAILRANGL